MKEEIERVIKSELPDATVIVTDPNNDGRHLEAVVVSKTFVSMPLLSQHKTVMSSLSEHFETSLHALKLKTLTPEQFEALGKK